MSPRSERSSRTDSRSRVVIGISSGRDAGAEALRKFRVSRIENVEANVKKPQSPDYEIPEDFDLADHARARESWELGDDAPEEMVVEIRGDSGAAVSVRSLGAEVAGAPARRRFQVRRVDSFARWLMSFAGEVMPVSPPRLCEQYRTVVASTLAMYDDGETAMSIDAGERLRRVLQVMPLIVDRDNVSVDEVQSRAGVDALTLLDDLRVLTEREDEPGGFVEAVSILFDANSVSVRSPHFGRPTRITLPELCALELGFAMSSAASTADERAVIDRARARIRGAIVALPESATRDDLWYASGPAVRNEQILVTLREARRAKAQGAHCVSPGRRERIDRAGGASVCGAARARFVVSRRPLRAQRRHSILPSRSRRIRRVARRCVRGAGRLSISSRCSPPNASSSSASAERLVVRYSARIARWISEREEGELAADGSFVVSHPLADDAWAVRHVLQYGPEAEVLEPARVRERLATTLRAMMRDME